MSLYVNDLVNILGQKAFDTANYSYTVYGNVAVWIEGHKGIKTFSQVKIVFSLKSGNIRINGEGLKIRQLTRNCALICGRNCCVEVDNV